jgi:hypothetical protein
MGRDAKNYKKTKYNYFFEHWFYLLLIMAAHKKIILNGLA